MSAPRWNRTVQTRRVSRALAFATILAGLAIQTAHAQVEYRFERMWPTLEQPWYMNNPLEIDVTSDGSVYVLTDGPNASIVKYSAQGQFLVKFGQRGNGVGDFNWPTTMSPSQDGNVYIYDRIQKKLIKYAKDGSFERKVGENDPPGLVFGNLVGGVATGPDGSVYVGDAGRLVKLDANLNYVTEVALEGSSDIATGPDRSVYALSGGAVHKYDADLNPDPTVPSWPAAGHGAIFVDVQGAIYVYAFNVGYDKYTSNGEPIGPFISTSRPLHAAGDNGSFYRADSDLVGVEKVDANLEPIAVWNSSSLFVQGVDVAVLQDGSLFAGGKRFTESGVFIEPWAVAGQAEVGADGLLYVFDGTQVRKFDATGQELPGWDFPVAMACPCHMATAPDGSVYFAEDNASSFIPPVNNKSPGRVRQFSSSGQLLDEWHTFNPQQQTSRLGGIAVSPDGEIYVIEYFGHGVTWAGLYRYDAVDDEFEPFIAATHPNRIEVGPDGNIYLAEGHPGFQFNPPPFVSQRIRVYDTSGTELYQIGEPGYAPAQFMEIHSMAFSPSGTLYTMDAGLRRIQKFEQVASGGNARAIVVAAGGPYPGNVLWDATQFSANFAYRALIYQGFTRDRIQYLSSSVNVDLDQNGAFDDVDATCTNTNLQNTITSWASGAENLIVYLVDHGGADAFRMGQSETLSAAQLEAWVDAVDPSISGKITIVYDACLSGSFVDNLTGPNRVVMTSSLGSEEAKFLSAGTISFSNFFWEQVFNGNDVNSAYSIAKQAMAPYQTSLIDANGNGIPNEAADLTAVTGLVIGSGTNFNLFRPVAAGPVGIIGGTTLSSGSTATIFADNVTDLNNIGDGSDDGAIARVWAVLRPPNFIPPSGDNAVTNFPIVEMLPVGGNRFEGTYSGFTTAGTYNIVIYALDNNTETSLPQLTALNVVSPLRKKAIIAVGTDPASPEWPVAQAAAIEAYETLKFQQYADSGPNEDIKFYAPATFSLGVDGTLTSLNLQTAINTWAASNTQDLVVYLIGPGNTDTFRLNATQNLSASTLDGWLDTLQATIPGVVTVLYDGPKSGSFRNDLLPPATKKRIFMASTNDTQSASFVPAGAICFSRFFWRDVANGANVNQAFSSAKLAVDGVLKLQVPGIDDNANGVVNEKTDGPTLARLHNLGTGIVLAGDAPLIGGDTGDAEIASGATQAFGVTDATSTGTIATVWAMIMPPGYSPAQPQRLVTADLTPTGGNDYSINYAGFTEQGDYTVAVFAEDIDGVLSLPRSMIITQPSDQFTEAPSAESLRNNFNALDANHNGGLTLAEAQAQIPGMTQALFDQLDDSANGLLSMAELLDATVGDPGETDDVYIDFAFSGVELGTPDNPFNSVTEAAAYAAAPGTLHMAPGTTAESTLLTRQATLRSTGGTVRIGAP